MNTAARVGWGAVLPDEPGTASARGDRLAFYAKLVADHCHDAIVVTDTVGRVEWINAAFTGTTGYGLDEVRGRKPGDILQGPETDRETVRRIADAIRDRRPIRVEILNYTKSGATYWIEMSITPVFDEAGRHTHYLAVERDITERRALEERTRAVFEAEAFQQAERKLLSEMSEWLYSAKSQEELLEVVELSMRTLMPEADGALFVYAPERDILERAAHWGDVPAPEHVAPDDCWSLRRGRPYYYGGQTVQLACAHTLGHSHPSFCLPVIAQGQTIGLMHLAFPAFRLQVPGDAAPHDEFLRRRWATALTCAEQISLAIANVRLRAELEERSVRDLLTGLRNRRWFHEAGPTLLRRALARGEGCALVLADVDHFKRFNDRFGHDAGDSVLAEVAGTMLAMFPEPAAVCRIGGEEFVVLLPVERAAEAEAAARSLLGQVAGLSVHHRAQELPPVTLSAGVAVAPDDGGALPVLLRAADRALYAAKEAGRNRVRVASALARPRVPGRTPAPAEAGASPAPASRTLAEARRAAHERPSVGPATDQASGRATDQAGHSATDQADDAATDQAGSPATGQAGGSATGQAGGPATGQAGGSASGQANGPATGPSGGSAGRQAGGAAPGDAPASPQVE